MCKHCIASDDVAPNRPHAQQLQSRFVFIRLGIHSQLSHSSVHIGRIGSNKVNCGGVSVATPAGPFAVDRDMKSVVCSEASLNPTADARLEVRCIDLKTRE
jgi:hypothetical protein